MNSETDSGGRTGRETSHLSYDSARTYSQVLFEPPGPPTLACLPPDSEQVSSWCLASTSKPTEGKEVGHRETHIHPPSSPSMMSGQTHFLSSTSLQALLSCGLLSAASTGSLLTEHPALLSAPPTAFFLFLVVMAT